jgi:archaellum component FlaC
MLKQLYEMARTLFGLTQDTQKNKAQIEELQRELKMLSETVRQLAFEIRRVHENDAHEREKMALRLENALLRFERRLPQSSSVSATDLIAAPPTRNQEQP